MNQLAKELTDAVMQFIEYKIFYKHATDSRKLALDLKPIILNVLETHELKTLPTPPKDNIVHS